MSVTEQQILEALHRIPSDHWPSILDFMDSFSCQNEVPGDTAMLANTVWTAAALQRLPRPTQDAVLREQAAALLNLGSATEDVAAAPCWWPAREVGKLPREQRAIILEASARLAVKEYDDNPDLTAFDAYGKDDLYVDSSDTQPR